jgi:hypothetical protein
MSSERFILEARLDQGRFGTVYRAVDTHESFDGRPRRVALWLLPPEFTSNKPAVELFRRDYRRIRELTHPAIARVYELGQDEDRIFVTSELLDGETLRNVLDHLRPEKLDSEEADEVISVVGDALAYAHELGIVHADVRSENVLVTTDHEIKLLNLMSTSLMRSSAFAGGPSGDVRDLAALAYALYTGQTFGDGERAKRIKGAPKRRVRAIERALTEPRPYANAREFLVDAGLARAPVSYYGAPRPAGRALPPPRERSSARRVVIPLAGAAALALGIYSGGNLDALLEIVPLGDWLGASPEAGNRPPPPNAATVEGRPDARDRSNERTRFGVAESEPPARADPSPQELAAVTPDARADGPAATPRADPYAESTSSGAEPRTARPPSETPPADELRSSESRPRDLALAAEASAPAASANPTAERVPNAPPRRLGTLALATAAVTAYESQTSMTIDVVRSGNTDEAAEVIWWTEDGTAHSGDDYASFGRRVEAFAPGETVRTLHIPITSDARPESDEHFYVHLDARSTLGPTGMPASATVTLIDDD